MDAQGTDSRIDAQVVAAVGVAQIGAEPAPAELAMLAAVVELAIDDEQDQFRAAVDDHGDVLTLSGLERSGIAFPVVFRAPVVHNQFNCAMRGGQQSQPLSPCGIATVPCRLIVRTSTGPVPVKPPAMEAIVPEG